MSGGRDRKGSNGCLQCICCCYCLLFLLFVIATGTSYYLYTVYQPKAPAYNLQSFAVKNFDVQSDLSLKIEFLVGVKASNPNKQIGFIYGADSNVSVVYNEGIIASGKLPAFKQDPGSTTVKEITLAGTSPNESGSLQDDVENNKPEGGIPLLVKVKVPVKVFVGKIELKEFMAFVNCDLVVDNLEQGKPTKVIENDCKPEVVF